MISNNTDLWGHLKTVEKHIVLYGMGNGADKILSVCTAKGIEVDDFFASDGFVRGHKFHGKTVLSFSEIKQKYGADNVIVLLSFGTNRIEVLANIRRIASECELYAPDVPVFGEGVFDIEYYAQHKSDFCSAQELFFDQRSKEIFDLIIEYKLTGNIDLLEKTECAKSEIYCNLLSAGKFEHIADLGAYNGDTIREIIPFSPNLKSIIAFEPDARSFKKLTEYSRTVQNVAINAINSCAWDSDTELVFDASGNRNSGVFENTSSIIADRATKLNTLTARRLDGIVSEIRKAQPDFRLDYIKYDVEGSEANALEGSGDVIRRDKPALLVSAYHKNDDLFRLPQIIKTLNPNYKLFLRRTPYLPAWDIHILAV